MLMLSLDSEKLSSFPHSCICPGVPPPPMPEMFYLGFSLPHFFCAILFPPLKQLFLRYNSHTIHHFQVHNFKLVVYSEFCVCHHNQFRNVSIPPKRSPTFFSHHSPSFPSPPALGKHLPFVSLDFPILHIKYSFCE